LTEYATRSKPTKKTSKPTAKGKSKKQVDIVPAMVVRKKRERKLEPEQELNSAGFVPSELQGHAVKLAEVKEHGPLVVIDKESGEELARHPAELFLEDNIKGYYSHSFMGSIAQCEASAYFRKIRSPMRPAFALERGSAIHNTIENYIKYGTDPVTEIQHQWDTLVTTKVPFMNERDQIKAKTLYEETLRMATDFVAENDELIKSGQVESEVEFSVILDMPLPNGKSFKRRIYGKIDFVVWNEDKTKYRIMDFKSSAKVPPDEELDRDVQFTLYQHAATQLYGFPPDKIFYYLLRGVHLCRTKDKNGKDTAVRFSKDHKRNTECMQYAFEILVKPESEIQKMITTYYMPIIIRWEAGIIGKNLKDAHWCVDMCGYKEICDKTESFPLPTFVTY
jgi:hypothetical protein